MLKAVSVCAGQRLLSQRHSARFPSVFSAEEAYIPANFNRRYNGPVRMRIALASSLNVPVSRRKRTVFVEDDVNGDQVEFEAR